MKWYIDKEVFTTPVHYGQKNNYKLEVISESVLNARNGYYIMIFDKKTKMNVNSLWIGVRFNRVESAKKWCESFAKERKDKRITREEKIEWINSDDSITI